MSQAKVEVEFDEQELSRLEALRGNTDLPSFIREITMLYLEGWGEEVDQAHHTEEGELLIGDEGLTPEDHIRMANEAKADWVSLEEVKKVLDRQIADLKAEHEVGTAR